MSFLIGFATGVMVMMAWALMAASKQKPPTPMEDAMQTDHARKWIVTNGPMLYFFVTLEEAERHAKLHGGAIRAIDPVD